MNNHKLAVVLICILLLLVVTSCTQNSQPTLKEGKNELVKKDYNSKVKEFDLKLQEILKDLGLNKKKLVLESRVESQQKKTTDHHFSWEYNYQKISVPLFGSEGKLLSDFRAEIIKRLKGKFPLITTEWVEKGEKERLIVELGFKTESNEVKIITHKLEFIQKKPKAKMAIVIDDFGFSRRGTDRMLSIDRPLTMAILPFRPHSQDDAKRAKEAGYEVILHQPLEPINPEISPGKGAIYTEMTGIEIRETLKNNLDSLPQVIGINNHMGSKATADSRVMEEVMKVLNKRDLFYLDSSTSHQSVGDKIARKDKVPTAENYLFIDNVDDKDQIEKMLLRIAKIALQKKELVTIGHVRENTALAIEEVIPKIEKMGIKLVFLSDLVK